MSDPPDPVPDDASTSASGVAREATISELLDEMSEAFVAQDRELRLVAMNRSAEAWFRSVVGEEAPLLGRTLAELAPEFANSELDVLLREAAARGGTSQFACRGPLTGRWLSCRTHATSRGLASLFRDDTAERNALDALRATEAQVQAMFRNSLDGLVLATPSGKILAANPTACRMLGYAEEDLRRLGRGVLTDPDDPALLRFLDERARTGAASGEFEHIRADGTRFLAEVRSGVFVDAQGSTRVSTTIRDVSERVRVERERAEAMAALREAEELFRLTIEHAPIGMGVCDLDGRYLRVNQRLCEIVGYSASELVERRFHDITHPDDLEKDVALTAALLRGEIPRYELPKRFVRKDGSIVDAQLHVSLVRDGRGAPRTFIAQIQDLTEKRRLEQQLRISDRMASIGTLASGVAHEINNPLAYVTSNLELAEAELGAYADAPDASRLDELARAIVDAREGAERVRRIVRGLRTFGRADVERRQSLDVRAALDVAITMAQNEIRHRARLVRDYADVPAVEADEATLVQAFLNLVVNAAQAIEEGSADRNEIRVSTRASDAGEIVIEIRDTGCGIAKNVLARIFDPFFTTKEVGLGTGLGLSITHSIVTALGGGIDVSSEPGQGSTFRVVLPASKAAATLTPASAPRPLASPTRARVLVVDDEPQIGVAVVRMLGRAYDASACTSGREALARIERGERFDAIVCDLMMPELGGAALFERVRAVDAGQARRMIFMTGGAFTRAARAFLDEIENPRLEKPFDLQALRAIVAEMSGTADAQTSEVG